MKRANFQRKGDVEYENTKFLSRLKLFSRIGEAKKEIALTIYRAKI